jgi:hypothetical protein
MKKILFYVGLIAIVALSSCYPDGPEYVEDMDIVLTNYDKDFNFSQPTTFSVPEHVLEVTGEPDPDNPTYLSDVYAKPILDAIIRNMEDRGYTQVADSGDLLIFPAALETDITTYYDYWYGYWGWYGSYYGWYYPPYYASYTFTVGTLLINMIDKNSYDPITESRNMVWVAGINGLTGYSTSAKDRINSTIDRAFDQSPYLKKN